MASPDVVAPALFLAVSFVALSLSVYNGFVHRATPIKGAVPLLLAVLAAVSGGTALSAACGEQLRIVSKVFANLVYVMLSSVAIYALSPSSRTLALPPSFPGLFLLLAALLIVCELISALIPTSPLLLPAILALLSRVILLALAIIMLPLLRCRHVASSREINIEKGRLADGSPAKTPGRVSSPTPATWPFPGSLALHDRPKRLCWPANKPALPDLPSSTSTFKHDEYQRAYRQVFVLLPLTLTAAQLFATLSAVLSVAASTLANSSTSEANHFRSHMLLASAVCTLLWSFMVLATIQVLPAVSQPHSSEKDAPGGGYEQRTFRNDFMKISRGNTMRTPKPSHSRRESNSLDFLSLRDPFASSPPPPPLPPVGLGLDEVEVGWDGNKEIGTQYRFPAPRSIVKGGRRKAKMPRVNGKKRLVHQDSARTLLPVTETRSPEADAGGDKEFGDEVRLAQLLLQSLSEGGDGSDGPKTPTPAPTPIVQLPQVAHVQQTSRWSTSTTVQSVMSASISNKSGVSTYTTCASEKVPTSRLSIASALGSRKSSEAKRKSATTASSSKG